MPNTIELNDILYGLQHEGPESWPCSPYRFKNRLEKFLAPEPPENWLELLPGPSGPNHWRNKILKTIDYNLRLLGHIEYIVEDGNGKINLCLPTFVVREDGSFLLRGARSPATIDELDLKSEPGREITVGPTAHQINLRFPNVLSFVGTEEQLRENVDRDRAAGDVIPDWDDDINEAVDNNLAGWEEKELESRENCTSPSIAHDTDGADEVVMVFDSGEMRLRPIEQSRIALRTRSCFLIKVGMFNSVFHVYIPINGGYERKTLDQGLDPRRWARFFMLGISGMNVIGYDDGEISVPISVPFPFDIERALVSATGHIPRVEQGNQGRTHYSIADNSVKERLDYAFVHTITDTTFLQSTNSE